VELPTGRTVRVALPADLKTGRTLRLRRQGLSAPGRWGDVYLRVVVAEPLRAAPPAAVDRAAQRPSASWLRRRSRSPGPPEPRPL
jgi:DnaJ-class molecular chaperone